MLPGGSTAHGQGHTVWRESCGLRPDHTEQPQMHCRIREQFFGLPPSPASSRFPRTAVEESGVVINAVLCAHVV